MSGYYDEITPRDVDGYCDKCGTELRFDFALDNQLCHRCSGGRTPDESLQHDDPECTCEPIKCVDCGVKVSWCCAGLGYDDDVCFECGTERDNRAERRMA